MTDKQRVQGDQFVLISEIDSKQRNIKDGDNVKVFNDRGSYIGVAKITSDVSSGIVVSTLGYWRQLNDGTVNSISSANLADMGNAPTFSDNLVEVIKI
jgi:anaerobic selenocysteine-containing dehydrogenase